MVDHLESVYRAVADRQAAQEAEHRAVITAYRAGVTWGQIGAVYGITKQAARKRFVGATEAEEKLERSLADFDEATRILDEQGPEAFLAHEKERLGFRALANLRQEWEL